MIEPKRWIVWLCCGCEDCEPYGVEDKSSMPCRNSQSMNGGVVVLAEAYDSLKAERDRLREELERERRISQGEAILSNGRAEEVADLTDRLQTRDDVLRDSSDRLGIALTALASIAEETGTPYGRLAAEALARAGARLDGPMPAGGER